jgi:hypothetical protein
MLNFARSAAATSGGIARGESQHGEQHDADP